MTAIHRQCSHQEHGHEQPQHQLTGHVDERIRHVYTDHLGDRRRKLPAELRWSVLTL